MQYRSIAPEELATWFQPRQALNLVQTAYPDIKIAARIILERLRGGLLKAGAKSSSWEQENFLATAPCFVPTEYWSRLADSSAYWWDTGDIRVKIYVQSRTSPVTGRYFGIRFEPRGVQEIVAEAPPRTVIRRATGSENEPAPGPLDVAPATSQQPVTPVIDSLAAQPLGANRGGRPRKDFWEALWAAICAQIWLGDLKAEKQADIENAMLDWASKHGHELSPPSARIRARSLMAAIRREDKTKGQKPVFIHFYSLISDT